MMNNRFKTNNTKFGLRILSIAVLFFCIILSCTTTYNTIGNRDFHTKYNPSQQLLHPEYTIYTNTPNDIRLYFRVFPSEFSFLFNQDSILTAKASLFFRVTKDYNSTQIIDSLSKPLEFKKNHKSSYLGYFPLNLPEEGNYLIEVFLSDLLAEYYTSNVLTIEVNKMGNETSFQFLSKYGSPLFYNHRALGDTIRIRSSMFNDDGLIAQYYKPDTLLPLSPDISNGKKTRIVSIDTSYYLAHPDTVLFALNRLGNYLIKNKSLSTGKLINSFNPHYPYIKTPEQMLSCLRYLCNESEMENHYKKTSAKNAVDTFWLGSTNDLEKARELIRIYYNRIQLANYYFSSYKEGWLTDMGMIYSICGAPNNIRIDKEGEHWYYGKNEKDNMTFNFYKQQHPIFGSEYVLDRSDVYSGIWYNAISTWRSGKVFSLNP